MLDPFDKIPDALKAKPERLDAGFAIAFSSEETTEHGDSSDDLVDGGRYFRDGFLGEDVCAFPLVGSEEQRRGEVRMRSPEADQASQSPRHDHIDGKGQFDLAGSTELQGFDSAIRQVTDSRPPSPSARLAWRAKSC